MSLEDDSSISEINILPDGRVCLFGASRQVLEMLDAIPLGDPALRSRIERCVRPSVQQPRQPAGSDALHAERCEPVKNRVRR